MMIAFEIVCLFPILQWFSGQPVDILCLALLSVGVMSYSNFQLT